MDHLLHLPLLQLAVALALGLLVGVERQWSDGKPLGLRSFALITVTGAMTGLLAVAGTWWIVGLGLLAVTLAVVAHSVLRAREEPAGGSTTELAALAMFLVGVLTTTGWVETAVVVGGTLTLLLHWKQPLHKMVHGINAEEMQAVVRFVLISLVILPVLPNEAFGPYSVLNPFQIWLMVVLIVALNLSGYFGLRITRGRGGAVLGGALGGLVSSTATTVSFATRAGRQPGVAGVAAAVILLASLLVNARILVETLAVAPALLEELILPLTAFSLLFVGLTALFLKRLGSAEREDIQAGNPAELGTALTFGAVYSVVIFVSAAVHAHFGEVMLYPVAVFSGLTDVDAITLSTARLFGEGRIDGDTAWRLIFVAAVSNLGFKTGVVAVLGGAVLRRRLLPAMAALVGAGVAMVVLWP